MTVLLFNPRLLMHQQLDKITEREYKPGGKTTMKMPDEVICVNNISILFGDDAL